ncbi:glycosyltransferase [Microcella alkalica]|uniref:glycosyltransferase n=1 Tax=Microcella alkalica TaxID=355930 RepID=UPI00145C584C|nr:glycosyltransferase [Microcella alkalica]
MSTLKTVHVVQPYVPAYREAFFESLRSDLRENGIQLRLIAGAPPEAQAKRGDAVWLPWADRIDAKAISIGSRNLMLTDTSRMWRDSSGVILPLMGSNFDIYRALVLKKVRPLRVGLWGHVKDYVSDSHPLDAAAERFQMRRADHIFAYTDGGAAFARSIGVARRSVTALGNTVDLGPLRSAIRELSAEEVEDFRREHHLNGPVYGYIGGLDASKGTAFLSEVLDALWQLDPSAKLLVGGRGEQESLLNGHRARGQVISLGYAGPREKALVAKTANALINPGRIGLIAVEAMEMGLPILTTSYEYHGPEHEYLAEGRDVVILSDSPQAFAHGMQIAARSVPRLERRAVPDLEQMVANFTTGVIAMLEN